VGVAIRSRGIAPQGELQLEIGEVDVELPGQDVAKLVAVEFIQEPAKPRGDVEPLRLVISGLPDGRKKAVQLDESLRKDETRHHDEGTGVAVRLHGPQRPEIDELHDEPAPGRSHPGS